MAEGLDPPPLENHKGIGLHRITGLGVIKLEYSLRLKIKCNDWLLADTRPQAANKCPLF